MRTIFGLLFYFISITFVSAQSTDGFYKKGLEFIELNQIDSAIKSFTKVVKLDEFHSNSYYNLGVCYVMKDEYSSSIPFFNKAISIDSNHFKARFNRAFAYQKTNNNIFAIFDYEYYIQKNPGDSIAYYNKALVYLSMNEKQNAFLELNKAIELSPYYEEALFERALIYREQKKYKKALDDIKACLFYDIDNLEYRKNEADLNFLLAQYDVSESKYVSLNQRNPSTFNKEQIAYCQMYLGKNWPAIESFTALINKDSTNASYFYNRAVVYVNIDRNEEAEKDLSFALSLKPKNLSEILNLRGIARYNQKKFNEACFDWQQSGNIGNIEGKNNLNTYCEKTNE